MKIKYTEENLRACIQFGKELQQGMHGYILIEEFIAGLSTKGAELEVTATFPTDDEIYKHSEDEEHQSKLSPSERVVFRIGAKWMRNKIRNAKVSVPNKEVADKSGEIQLLKEMLMRSQLAFPENEQDEKQWNEQFSCEDGRELIRKVMEMCGLGKENENIFSVPDKKDLSGMKGKEFDEGDMYKAWKHGLNTLSVYRSSKKEKQEGIFKKFLKQYRMFHGVELTGQDHCYCEKQNDQFFCDKSCVSPEQDEDVLRQCYDGAAKKYGYKDWQDVRANGTDEELIKIIDDLAVSPEPELLDEDITPDDILFGHPDKGIESCWVDSSDMRFIKNYLPSIRKAMEEYHLLKTQLSPDKIEEKAVRLPEQIRAQTIGQERCNGLDEYGGWLKCFEWVKKLHTNGKI